MNNSDIDKNPILTSGEVFGLLTVLSENGISKGEKCWLCQCGCGNKTTISTSLLVRRIVDTCGCNLSLKLHGMSKSPEYSAWSSMIQRCDNPNNPSFSTYGGRGIKVCPRWYAFKNFIADMGVKPSQKHSLDRIDVNKGYELSNCRWATNRQQLANKQDSILIEWNNKTQTIREWAEELNIDKQTLYMRLAVYKWSIEKALTSPLKKPGRPKKHDLGTTSL